MVVTAHARADPRGILAFNWLGLRRIEVTVYADNAAAVRLYRKVGFAIEGTARRFALRDGVLVDAHHMALFRHQAD
jgi:putative acetyltransferase